MLWQDGSHFVQTIWKQDKIVGFSYVFLQNGCHLVIAQKSIILTVWKPDKGQPFENRTCPVFRTPLYCVILKRFDNPLVWSVFQRYQVFLLCFKIRILKSWSKWIDCIGKLSEWQIFLLPTFGVSLAHYLHSVGQTAIKIVRFNRFQ